MRTIKIFAFPTHGTMERVTGVDFARIIQPMQHLDGYKLGDVEFKVTLFDPVQDGEASKKHDWISIANEYDIIYLNYLPDAWGFAAMGAMARSRGRKLVLDIDDSLWDLKVDNSAYTVYHKGSEALGNFTAMCNEVDYMTCTNPYLKNVILNNTYKTADRVKVLPNYIDLNLYKHVAKPKENDIIYLYHYGSTTHFVDLQSEGFAKGVDRIMRDYPNVRIKFIGAFIPEFKKRWGARYENAFGHADIYRWVGEFFPQFMDEADIMVVPLTDDKYNRCKSSIKFMETASAKIPGVWQYIRQYSEVIDGTNGLLARNEDEWYEQIKKLVDSAELRRTMGENAYKTIKKNWQLKDHVKDYAEFMLKVLDS